jgi:2,3-bisphosphoglycerate-independent phosphoglycerate mutase
MIDPLTGIPETKHDANPVPIYLVGKEFEKPKDTNAVDQIENETSGILSDVAPTVLKLLEINKPAEMTGESLLGRLG